MVGTEPKPFGFIVHPLTPMQRRLLGVRSADIPLALGAPRGRRHVHTISHLKLAALSGHTQRGILVSVPALPKELLEDQEYGLMLLREAIEVCAGFGAQVVGLGAVNAMIGGQGKRLASNSPIPITTGNTMTAYAAFETVSALIDRTNRRRSLSIIGPPSPVANALVELLLRRGHHLTILSSPIPKPLRSRVERLNKTLLGTAEFTDDLNAVSGPEKILVAASSTGGRLKLGDLPSGSLIVDVAAPADVVRNVAKRSDVLILDGELIRPPRPLRGGLWRSIYGLVTGQSRSIFACFIEPMLLAMESEPKSLVGRTVDLKVLDKLGLRAHAEGFMIDGFHTRGRSISRAQLARFLVENDSTGKA